jgi:hypothetical protein
MKSTIQFTIILCLFSIAACKKKPDEVGNLSNLTAGLSDHSNFYFERMVFYDEVYEINGQDTSVEVYTDSVFAEYENGLLVRLFFNEATKNTDYVLYNYDSNNLPTNIEEYYDGELIYYIEFIMGSDGKVQKMKTYEEYLESRQNSIGGFLRRSVNNTPSSKLDRKSNRNSVPIELYATYDFTYNTNTLTEVKAVFEDDNSSEVKVLYTYNKVHNPIKREIEIDGEVSPDKFEFKYDDKKNSYNLLGPFTFFIHGMFSENNIVESKSTEDGKLYILKFEYEYDENGFMKTKTESHMSSSGGEIIRTEFVVKRK